MRAQIAQMSETLLPSHPRVQEAEANLADLQVQIEKEVHKVIEALENEARVATARVNSLRASLNRLQRRMGQLNQDEVKLRALQRDADTNRALLEIASCCAISRRMRAPRPMPRPQTRASSPAHSNPLIRHSRAWAPPSPSRH